MYEDVVGTPLRANAAAVGGKRGFEGERGLVGGFEGERGLVVESVRGRCGYSAARPNTNARCAQTLLPWE